MSIEAAVAVLLLSLPLSEGERELTEQEQAEIEKALAADAAARQAREADPPPQSAGFVQSLNPDLSFIGVVAVAGFSADEPLVSGGHDPSRNGFNLQTLELAIGAAVDPYFRFDGNLAFGQFGVELEEAYATTLALPYGLQARAGQLLTRFGRHNPTHLHAWTFADQPFAIGRVFGSEGNRGLGVEVSWLAPLSWYAELVGSATDAAGEGTARSFFGAAPLPVSSALDFQLTGALKQFFPLSDDLSLSFGLSAATGPNATGHDNRTNVFGTDLYLKYRPLSGASSTIVSLEAEIFYRRRQVPGDVLSDWNGYCQLTWTFHRHWGTAARYELGTPALGWRRETVDDLDPEWTEARQRLSASLTFAPTEFSKLRLQGGVDLPGWRPAPEYFGYLTFEFSVGAHGAHKF